ncbi:replication protein A 70 kDa DNA-binding subunit B-like [Pistacia vera]|uniref:replication protein A 70 kDa DNA-binding subunit B-like n=1 Tax=Pistacia vera TaxID=55513 RepID=UPI001263CB50|nr:replication protein A 70 kDa DNA-binding subunit B-like [Pistacia vera]
MKNIPVVKLQKRKLNEISVEEEMFQNRVSLKYLNSLMWYNWDRITEYTIKGKIIGVNGRFGWCYLSCSVCKKKIPNMNNSNFYCLKCNKEIKFPQMRYKVDIALTDGTVEAAFIMFDSVCQKLVGLSCSQLLKTQENNHERILDVVNAFCVVFKIKLSEIDLKLGYETYTAVEEEDGKDSSIANAIQHQALTPKITDKTSTTKSSVEEQEQCSIMQSSNSGTSNISKEKGEGTEHQEPEYIEQEENIIDEPSAVGKRYQSSRRKKLRF